MRLKIAFAVAYMLSVAGMAQATVGGPTLIHDFRYDPESERVLYIKQDYGGRGCPPELLSLDIGTNKTEEIFSCSYSENNDNYQTAFENQGTRISEYMTPFTNISAVNLNKNNFSITIEKIRENPIEEGSDWIISTDFVAHVYQGELKVADIPMTGCNVEQPFIFDGYKIPERSDVVVLLVSRKGDCFEGGYTHEFLHAVSNVSLAADSWASTYKISQPLVPHEGSLVVYASQAPTEEVWDYDKITLIISIALVVSGIVVGFLLGRSMSRRRQQLN